MRGVRKSGNKFVCFSFSYFERCFIDTECIKKLFEVTNLLNFCLVRDFIIVFKYFLDLLSSLIYPTKLKKKKKKTSNEKLEIMCCS